MSLTPDYQRDWPAYFDAVANQPPRDTLVRALDAFEKDDAPAAKPVWRVAVDIAAGEGRDTREILRRNGATRWKVMAVEHDFQGCDRLSKSVSHLHRDRLYLNANRMEEVAAIFHKGAKIGSTDRLVRQVDLINASFALPFCHEDHFPALWDWILKTLKPGGRFAGQIFGDRDEWAAVNPRRHFTREQTLALLAPFDVEHLDEVEKDGSDALMRTKHHHLFHIVARKR